MNQEWTIPADDLENFPDCGGRSLTILGEFAGVNRRTLLWYSEPDFFYRLRVKRAIRKRSS